MALRFRYVGEGAFLPGIPARDIGDAEWEALTDEQREVVAIARIYEAADGGAKQAPTPAPTPAASEEE